MLQLAYLDPATGAIVFQAIIGSVLAALLTVKFWFVRVKLFFLGLIGRAPAASPDTLDGEAASSDASE